jgi:hypothetical protein
MSLRIFRPQGFSVPKYFLSMKKGGNRKREETEKRVGMEKRLGTEKRIWTEKSTGTKKGLGRKKGWGQTKVGTNKNRLGMNKQSVYKQIEWE